MEIRLAGAVLHVVLHILYLVLQRFGSGADFYGFGAAVFGVGDGGFVCAGVVVDFNVAFFAGNYAALGLLGAHGQGDDSHFAVGVFQQDAAGLIDAGLKVIGSGEDNIGLAAHKVAGEGYGIYADVQKGAASQLFGEEAGV